MAIVYSYPTATPEEQDLLVGTEMAVQGGEDAPRTRTFTVGSVIGLLTPALNLKANIASPTFTGVVTSPSFVKTGGTASQFLMAGGTTTTTGTGLLLSGGILTGVTNLTLSQTSSNFTISSDTGTDAVVPLGNGISAGASMNDYTNAEKTKLGNISGTNTGDQNLQAVTNINAITTLGIGAASFTKTGGLSNEFLKANGTVDNARYSKNIVSTSSLSGNPTGGTTTLALRESTLIPGGALQDKDCIDLTCFFGKTNSNAAGAIYVYINSTDSLSGATLIAYYSFPNDLVRGQLTRKWIIRSPYVSGFYNGGVSSNTGTENVTSTFYPSEFAWDVTTSKYLLIAMQMDSSSDGILYYGTNLKN